MPTSRYWLHSPSACSAAFAAAAAALPGTMSRKDAPISPAIRAADRLGLRRVAGGALLDHPLDHRAGEGHAAGLERLQVAGRDQPRPVLVPAPRRIGESVEPAQRPARRGAQPPGRIVELQEVAHRRHLARGDVDHRAVAHGDDARPPRGRRPRPADPGAVPVLGMRQRTGHAEAARASNRSAGTAGHPRVPVIRGPPWRGRGHDSQAAARRNPTHAALHPPARRLQRGPVGRPAPERVQRRAEARLLRARRREERHRRAELHRVDGPEDRLRRLAGMAEHQPRRLAAAAAPAPGARGSGPPPPPTRAQSARPWRSVPARRAAERRTTSSGCACAPSPARRARPPRPAPVRQRSVPDRPPSLA